jgi:hypothetical protein
MGLTKAQLEALNQSSFPDNQEELITPEVLRTYNAASIDNTVNQDTYTTDSASFDSRINGFVAGTGFLSTASFNAYTASTNSEISAIESFTASVSTSVGLLQTFSGSQYKIDSASFSSRINTAGNTGLVTTASFNEYTSSNDTKVNNLTAQTASYALSASVAAVDIEQDGKIASLTSATSSYAISSSVKVVTDSLQTQINGLATTSSVNTLSQSVDSRLDTLETAGYVTATITGSSLITASVSQSTITFTKGDGSQFNIVVADVSGSAGDFVTTASFNAFTQSISSSVDSISSSVGVLQTEVNGLTAQTASYAISSSVKSVTDGLQNQINTLATTSSLNDLSASIYSTDSTQSSLINGKLDTSSFSTFSTSVDSRLDLLELSGSGFATTASVNALSESIYQTDSTQSNDIINNSSSFATSISASNFNITNNSASVAVTINNLSASIFQTDATQSNDITALSASNAFDHSRFATTGSNTFNGNQTINGDISSSGTLTVNVITASAAQITYLHTLYETSSVVYSSGSNQLGDELTDVQILSGSVEIVGGLTVNGVSVSTQSVDISSLNAFTASQIVSNSYFATTGSNTFNGNQNITGSLTASGLKYPSVDNGEKSFIQTDGNGNLSLQYVDTIFEAFYAGESVPKGTPLYLSGSVGANPIARAADASDPNKMPVTLIANENLTATNTYEGIVLGLIEGLDLTGFTAGQTIYVAEGGGYSTSLPSGSTSITQVLGIVTKGGSGGKGLVLNPGPAQLPGLIEGYVWVGNNLNQPVAVATSSFIEDLSGYTTTASFNDYTQSTNTFTASISTSVGLLQTFSGSEYKADSASFSSRINGIPTINTGSFATTGSNTFIGNQTINGAVQISSSATYDLDITGGFQATAASRVSGSLGISTIGQTTVTVVSGSGVNALNTTIARGYISIGSGSSNNIALYSGILPLGGLSSAKTGGGIAVSTGTPGNYYFPIEFQATTAYTDGRVIFNTPISASAGITSSNAFINGELYSVTSASFDSRINAGGSIYTGSFAITGSNTFIGDQNINGNITASKLLVTDSGTTAIEYQLQSTGSVMGVYNTSYGKDNIKVYQYQGQPYAFNVNLTANQANAYTGSQFEWGLQLNGSNVSLPGGGGTYFAMVSGSNTGSAGDPGADKKGLDYLGTSMILDMYADTSFRSKVYVDKGMFVSQSVGGSSKAALTVDGTSAASNRAINATGSVSITGSLTVNGHQLFSPAYGSFTATAISGSGFLSSYTEQFAIGVQITSGSRLNVTDTGYYQVSAQVNFDAGGVETDVSIGLEKNRSGGIAGTKMSTNFSANSDFAGCNTTALVQLNAGEFIEVNVDAGTATIDNNNARVSIVRIA